MCDNHGPKNSAPYILQGGFDETEITVAVFSPTAGAATAQSAPETGKPFVIEYYYKAKWGHADEFLQLFKKNHYPLLKKEVEMGRMLKVWMDQPRYHTTEDGRWDYRVTIVFKNSTLANEPFEEDALKSSYGPIRQRMRKKSNVGSRSSMDIGTCRSKTWIWTGGEP